MDDGNAAFDYAAFIEEVRGLIGRAKAFAPQDKRYDSPALKQWRHQLHDYIQRIEREGYRINCDDVMRVYFVRSYGSVSGCDQSEASEKDLSATIGELEHLLEAYNKYGDPGPNKRRSVAGPIAAPVEPEQQEVVKLEVPERITMPWIWRNASATFLWTVIIGAIVFIGVVFSFGVFMGGTKAGQQFMDWFKPAAQSDTKSDDQYRLVRPERK
ncbi:hypothetical protein ACFQ3P_40095 [Paraburkholderia sabiae]|uniref:Uncharacterized protein n=1 Tax=Paraburkholderia sabiae TaxID=273251 RepID=A0ABU9QM40_9BURK|nr:hypothetical protein [Paraburkholderia sabiae]WJZ79983.1 hypothetical protein QEN71_43330 [Paraburkholderia sabiae]CAD6561196.1 hypothetical protein LMG24235_07216 [Paraburkholderia sabiae]